MTVACSRLATLALAEDGEMVQAHVEAVFVSEAIESGLQERGGNERQRSASFASEVLMVMVDGEMPSPGLGAEVDVMDHTDACQFVERAVRGGGVDRSDRPFDCVGQNLLHGQKPFAMAGEYGADGAAGKREPKPGASDPLVKQGLDLRRVVVGPHRGKGSGQSDSNESHCYCI